MSALAEFTPRLGQALGIQDLTVDETGTLDLVFEDTLAVQIPDSQLSPAMKTSMLKEIFPSWIGESNVAKGISEKTYEGALPLLTTNDVLQSGRKDGSRVPAVGKIGEITYQNAISSPKLDRAEYIVLTLWFAPRWARVP